MTNEGRNQVDPYPEKDRRTFGYEVARTTIDAAASLIPGGSYAVGKLVETVVAAPLQKRRDDWFMSVGLAINDLASRVSELDISALPQNEDFITAVYEATQCAMKTKDEAKLEALRNAVLNIAAGATLEETLRPTFFTYIDRFTPAHIHVLRLLNNPSASPEMVAIADRMSMGAQIVILREAVPERMISQDALDRVLSDLNKEGLADTGSMNVMASQGSFLAKRTTRAGDAFIRFISAPI
jgi:hypothetical protein